MSERTFNFARYASVWFFKGDLETRRAIFACLGSNFSIKDRKLNIQLRKPFELLFENLDGMEKEMLTVRTAADGSNKGQIVSSGSLNPLGRAVRDDIRTLWVKNDPELKKTILDIHALEKKLGIKRDDDSPDAKRRAA